MKLRKKVNVIHNEDCLKTMEKMSPNSVDLVITSPPYNNSRVIHNSRSISKHESRLETL